MAFSLPVTPASSQAIKHPPNLDKPALLAFLSSMLSLPTRHWYLLFSLSAMEPSQHHTSFYIVVNIYNTKFTILASLIIYFISIKHFHIVMQKYRILHKFVYHP